MELFSESMQQNPIHNFYSSSYFLTGKILFCMLVILSLLLVHIPTDNWEPLQSLRWRKGREEIVWFIWDWVFIKHIKMISSISLPHLPNLYLNGFLYYLYLLYLKSKKSKQHNQNVSIYHLWPQITKCFPILFPKCNLAFKC